MSEYSLDEPGFKAPGAPPPAPHSSDSSVETPPDARRKCIACLRRMSKKTADRHTLCVNCRGFGCDLNNRCEECLEWPEEEVKLYAKYRKSLKSKDSSSKSKSTAPPPPADSRPSLQPSPRDDFQSQIDSLNVTVNSLAESLSARLDAFMTRRRAMSPSGTPLLLVWQTSFMRSVRTLVHCLTPRVSLAAVLSLGSASQRLRLPSSTSGSTPGSRRWSRRLLLGRRIWLAAPNLSRTSSPLVRVVTRWRMIFCSRRPIR